MKLAACFLLLSSAVYSSAPADEPTLPATQPAASAVAPSQAPAAQAPAVQGPAPSPPSNASDANPAPVTAAAPAAKPDNVAATDAEIKQMRSRGYKPVSRNGTMVFCRDEAEIGSHFQRTRCSTLKQLKDAELSGKEFVNTIQQQGSAVPFKGP
jgi:hypothetical protein